LRRSLNRRTPGQFRTWVITDGVVPSLHVDYKKSRMKQYHKEGQALRTETTTNDTREFGMGRRMPRLQCASVKRHCPCSMPVGR
jgi:hypothetical protein